MFEFLKSTPKSLLGVDISSSTVKLLEISKQTDRYRVESYAVVPLPSGVVVEKNIKDAHAVSDALRKALTKSKSQTNLAAIAVPDSAVITKVIQMASDLSDDEMEGQIIVEADKYVPYSLDEVRMDFDVIQPSANQPDLVDVLLVASRSENVDIRVQAMSEAGVIPRVVDVESYAMQRCCELIASELPNRGVKEVIGILDIGSIMTNLTVLYDMATVFTREEVFGGEQLTKAIQRHYGLSYAEAGLAKKTGDLPDDYESEVLAPFKESAVLQVRRALQFFFSESSYNQISHLILAGGTVAIPGLAEMIQEQIGITTTIANPFIEMSISSNVDAQALTKDASALMIPCGLAMRSFDSDPN